MAKSKSDKTPRRRGVRSKKFGGRRNKFEVHLISDAFGISAAAVPFVLPGGGAGQSVVEVFQTQGFNGGSVMNAVYAVEQSTIANWKDIVVLGIMAVAAKWGAKKIGLNKVGTKKVKIG